MGAGGEAGHGVGIWLWLLSLGWDFWLILRSRGRGYLNLSSLNVGIFERRPQRKRLRPTLFFPRHVCAIRLEIMLWWMSTRSRIRERWVNLTFLSLNFPLIWSVFVDLNVFRYCSIEINGNKEKASRIFYQWWRSVYGPVATRGGEIFVHLTGTVCPWVGNLTAKFKKMSNPHPLPCLPPPPKPALNW